MVVITVLRRTSEIQLRLSFSVCLCGSYCLFYSGGITVFLGFIWKRLGFALQRNEDTF